jgi:GNAT superfamily N-acetyltransferase
LLNEKPVEVCALVKMNNGRFDYELAKMAVSPSAQGHGIGFLLGKAIIEKSRELGGKEYLP